MAVERTHPRTPDKRRRSHLMNVRIHRGCDEIGGSCVEIEYGGFHLVIDVGRPLNAGRDESVPLPTVTGLADGSRSIVGVLLSHGHQDHWGLVDQVHPSIPIYAGLGAANVLRAAEFWGSGIDLHEAGHFCDRVPLRLGPFTVTPYLVDHSGFDAYAFLVDAGGHRLMYSGDVRGHGRKASLFNRLVAHPPRNVDALLLEGTHVGQLLGSHGLASETAVEDALTALARTTAGAVVTVSSAQNIDRLVTCYRAALRSGRELAIDLYTAEVIAATGRSTIPQPSPDWPNVKVLVPGRQRVRVRDSGRFDKTERVRAQRIYPERVAAAPGRYLLAGAFQSEVPRMLRNGVLTDGCVVWSLWDGYLTGVSGLRLTGCLADAGVAMVQLHTSGHACPADLRRLVTAIRPTTVVPIHTEYPQAYSATFDVPVSMHPNGSWWAA